MSKSIHDRFPSMEEANMYISWKASRDFGAFVFAMSQGEFRLYDIHKEWFNAINDYQKQFINISTFPGCGKTTLICLWLAWRIGQEPYLTWMIVSSSYDQACDRIMAIRRYMEMPVYKMVFPHIGFDTTRPLSRETFTVKSTKWKYTDQNKLDYTSWRMQIGSKGEFKDPTIAGFGVTSDKIMGTRITGGIVLDDIHNQKNALTEEQRYKTFNIVQGNIKSRLTVSKVSKYPKMINICNRWHPTDTAGRLSELVREDGQPVWENIITPIEDEDGNPTFPEKFSTELVAKLREEQGGHNSPSWRMGYLVNPVGASNNAFTLEKLRVPLPEPLPEFQDIVIAVDFAHTQSLTSDYTVFTAIARDKNKPFNVYILDCKRMKLGKVSDKIKQLIGFYHYIKEIYQPEVKYIVFEHRDSSAEVQFLQSEAPEIPTKVVKLKGDKATRLSSFEGYVQTGKVYFNMNMPTYNAMVGELMDFPAGKHDDICDTLSMVWQLPEWVNRFGQSSYTKIELPVKETKTTWI